MLISAYCLTFFAAYAVTALAGKATRPRPLAVGAFVLAVSWSLVRGLDPTYQMVVPHTNVCTVRGNGRSAMQ